MLQAHGGASRRLTTENDFKLSSTVEICSGLCEQHYKTVNEIVEKADDKLFANIIYNKQHFTPYAS